jgi:hypothetical protein
MDHYGESVMKHLAEGSGISEHQLRRLPGLAPRHELRQRLQCKSFHWYALMAPPLPLRALAERVTDVGGCLHSRYVENVIYRIARKWGFPLVPEEKS